MSHGAPDPTEFAAAQDAYRERQRRRKYLAEVDPLLISPRRAGMAALRHSLELTGNECRVPVVASIEDFKRSADR
jgi:hypothetical protein